MSRIILALALAVLPLAAAAIYAKNWED